VSRAPAERAPAEFGQELQFLRAVWEFDHALESASRSMKAKLGVTGRERLIVRIVGERPGITPGELAEVLHVHPSTVTALLKRLERKRHILRTADAADARSSRLTLSASGRRLDALRTGTIESGVRAALALAPPHQVSAAAELLVAIARRLRGNRARLASAGSPRLRSMR
jgi:DNA-binding MarR family transcriptional regulator